MVMTVFMSSVANLVVLEFYCLFAYLLITVADSSVRS